MMIYLMDCQSKASYIENNNEAKYSEVIEQDNLVSNTVKMNMPLNFPDEVSHDQVEQHDRK